MHVLFVSFDVAGMSEREYFNAGHAVAPHVSGVSGLLAKVWLSRQWSERFGAIYFFEDRPSMERFIETDLFEGANEEFDNLIVGEFEVLENLTAITQPGLEVLTGEPAMVGSSAAGGMAKGSTPAEIPLSGGPKGKRKAGTKATAKPRTATKRTERRPKAAANLKAAGKSKPWAAAKPKATPKPKAAAKPKSAIKPTAAARPKSAPKPRAAARPKSAIKPTAAARPKSAPKPRAAARPKSAPKPKATGRAKGAVAKASAKVKQVAAKAKPGTRSGAKSTARRRSR
ncbi:MAG: YdhR family protein [Actinomycetota bacterium]